MGRVRLRLHTAFRGFRRLHRPCWNLWLGGIFGICMAFLLISSVEYRLRPVLESMAVAKVKNVAVEIMDQTVVEQLSNHNVTYEDFVHVEKDENGNITALTSDMLALNHFRSESLTAIVENIESLNSADLSIPVGNLTGVHILSGKGFSLPVEIISVASAHGNYSHDFSSAGINQTRHQISLRLTVTTGILLPGEILTAEVTADIPVAETVIVGAVPDTYLNLEPSS